MEKEAHGASSVHQPHDKLIKKMLSNPAVARDILSLYLPEEVQRITELNYLELQKDSFIDDEHRAYAVDLLYKTRIQQEEGYIWLLLEHQRKSDHWMPVRIFKYIAIIWDHLRKTSKSKSIPLIYPMVIYNGDNPYSHSLILSDLIQPETSRKIFGNLFTQPFCLVDLAAIEDEVLRNAAQDRVRGVALLMALKHVFDRDLQEFLEKILIRLLKQLDQTGDTDEVADVLYYLQNENQYLNKGRLWNIFHEEFSSEVEGKMTTIVQQIRAEGKAEGKAEGREETRLDVAKRLLAEVTGLGKNDLIALVHRITGLSMEKIRDISVSGK